MYFAENRPTSPDVVHIAGRESDVSFLLLFVICNRYKYVTQLLHFATVVQNVNLQKKNKTKQKAKSDLSLGKKLHCDSSRSCLSSDCVELVLEGQVFQ